jgi:hypothetical protein
LALIDAGVMFDLLLTDVILTGGMNGRVLADEDCPAAAGDEGPVYVRLYRELHRSSRPSRSRRAAAGEAISKIELARMVRVALQ